MACSSNRSRGLYDASIEDYVGLLMADRMSYPYDLESYPVPLESYPVPLERADEDYSWTGKDVVVVDDSSAHKKRRLLCGMSLTVTACLIMVAIFMTTIAVVAQKRNNNTGQGDPSVSVTPPTVQAPQDDDFFDSPSGTNILNHDDNIMMYDPFKRDDDDNDHAIYQTMDDDSIDDPFENDDDALYRMMDDTFDDDDPSPQSSPEIDPAPPDLANLCAFEQLRENALECAYYCSPNKCCYDDDPQTAGCQTDPNCEGYAAPCLTFAAFTALSAEDATP